MRCNSDYTQDKKIDHVSASRIEPLLEDYNASVLLDYDSMYSTDLEIKGSCRGFILFCCSSNFYIWNPSTVVHKQIPISPFVGSKLDVRDFYGFGYDHSTDDYLVVLMSRHYSGNSPLHLEYFSLKANTWKQVEGPHSPYSDANVYAPKGGTLCNGAIHWLAFRNDLRKNVIVAFDLMEKKLSYMLLPRSSDGKPLRCSLWVYGEFLSICITNCTNNTVEIWVMKEYKVNLSWTMTLALPIDGIPLENFSPLCCTKNGDIVGIGKTKIGDIVGIGKTNVYSGLVKYDKNGQFLEQQSYTNVDLRCHVTTYIESLLSLPSDGDNQQA